MRYARSGEISIAYQVLGEEPRDIVFVPGVVSHVEFFHELPGYTEFLERLGSFAHVIVLDKRGNGPLRSRDRGSQPRGAGGRHPGR